MGVCIDGVDKLSYNHSDSGPDYLGSELVGDFTAFVHEYGLMELAELARSVRCVRDIEFVSREEYEHIRLEAECISEYAAAMTWYEVLREKQGYLFDLLKLGVLPTTNTFILDSLFCEWGYIFNFDMQLFEIYRGYQVQPHTYGRFANGRHPEYTDIERSARAGQSLRYYYPCALIEAFSFAQIPLNWAETLIHRVTVAEGL